MRQFARNTPKCPAPRRVVLVAEGGSVESVLAEPPADEVDATLRRLRVQWPGRTLAAEWLKSDLRYGKSHNAQWVRWITTTEDEPHEGPIATT